MCLTARTLFIIVTRLQQASGFARLLLEGGSLTENFVGRPRKWFPLYSIWQNLKNPPEAVAFSRGGSLNSGVGGGLHSLFPNPILPSHQAASAFPQFSPPPSRSFPGGVCSFHFFCVTVKLLFFCMQFICSSPHLFSSLLRNESPSLGPIVLRLYGYFK